MCFFGCLCNFLRFLSWDDRVRFWASGDFVRMFSIVGIRFLGVGVIVFECSGVGIACFWMVVWLCVFLERGVIVGDSSC